MRLFEIAAADLDVQRRRHAQVEHRIHQAAGLKVGIQLRQLPLELRPHSVHVLEAAEGMVVAEPDLYERCVRTGVRGVDRGEARGGADVRYHNPQLIGRHDLAHQLLDLVDQPVGQLQARSGRGLDVDHELPGIGAREVCLADQRVQSEAEDEEPGDSQDGRGRTQ